MGLSCVCVARHCTGRRRLFFMNQCLAIIILNFVVLGLLKGPNVLETFQAMIGKKFAPLTIINDEDTDLDSMITTFNTAVTETACKIVGKHCLKKKTRATAEILDLCDRRRELRT